MIIPPAVRQHLFTLIKVAVAVSLLLFLYNNLQDPAALWQLMRAADKGQILVAGIFYAAAVFTGTVKWYLLLRTRGVMAPFRSVLALQWIGEFFNYALPTSVGGDLMRGYGLARDTHRRADAAVSVVIDRFIGLTTFMVSAAGASIFVYLYGKQTNGMPFSPENQQFLLLVTGVSLLAAAALLTILAILLSRRLKEWFEWVLCRLPMAQTTLPIWRRLAEAFNAYRHHYGAMVGSALGSFLILALTAVTIWQLASALRPGSIPYLYAFTMNPIISFALLVPITPGGAGIRQGAFVALFGLVGVEGDLAFAVGLMQHALGLLVSLPGVYLWATARARQTEPADDPAKERRSPE